MIGLGVQNDRIPVHATIETNLVTAFTSTANIVLSYGQSDFQCGGHVLTKKSESQYILHLCSGAEESQRLPKGIGGSPVDRYFPLRRSGNCDLLLYWPEC